VTHVFTDTEVRAIERQVERMLKNKSQTAIVSSIVALAAARASQTGQPFPAVEEIVERATGFRASPSTLVFMRRHGEHMIERWRARSPVELAFAIEVFRRHLKACGVEVTDAPGDGGPH
jgi:hypothetical protein